MCSVGDMVLTRGMNKKKLARTSLKRYKLDNRPETLLSGKTVVSPFENTSALTSDMDSADNTNKEYLITHSVC